MRDPNIALQNPDFAAQKARQGVVPRAGRPVCVGIEECKKFAGDLLIGSGLPGRSSERGYLARLLPHCGVQRGIFAGGENGVADGTRTRNNKLHKLGLYH